MRISKFRSISTALMLTIAILPFTAIQARADSAADLQANPLFTGATKCLETITGSGTFVIAVELASGGSSTFIKSTTTCDPATFVAGGAFSGGSGFAGLVDPEASEAIDTFLSLLATVIFSNDVVASGAAFNALSGGTQSNGTPSPNGFNLDNNDGFVSEGKITPTANGIDGEFSYGDLSAERPWLISADAGLSILNDNTVGDEKQAHNIDIALTGLMRWDDQTDIGVIGRFDHSEVDINATDIAVIGDTLSLTVLAKRKLIEQLTLGVAASFAHGESTIDIAGVTGAFATNTLAIDAALSNTTDIYGLQLLTSLSAGISQVRSESYEDSNGVLKAGFESIQSRVRANATLSRTFDNIGSLVAITPKIGVTASYLANDTGNELGAGLSLNSGINFEMDGGALANIDASYGVFQDNVETWSVSAGLAHKF